MLTQGVSLRALITSKINHEFKYYNAKALFSLAVIGMSMPNCNRCFTQTCIMQQLLSYPGFTSRRHYLNYHTVAFLIVIFKNLYLS